MTAAPTLESRLAEVLMNALAPCDLGEGIEVVHDVEAVEVEMECSIDDDDEPAPPVEDASETVRLVRELLDDELGTVKFTRELADDLGTHQFVRYSAPYERIEIQLDAGAFRRATIEEAKALRSSGTSG